MTKSKSNELLRVILLFASVMVVGKIGYNWITQIDKSTITNNNNGEVQIIGHGAYGIQSLIPFQWLPTNSESSIRKSLSCKIDGIELDVQVTVDSILVLYHDQKLEDATDQKGCIGNSLWRDVKKAKYQIGFPYDWLQNEKLISLEKALDLLLDLDEFPLLYIDFHGMNFCDTDFHRDVNKFCLLLDRLLLEKHVPMDKVYLIAIYEPVIEAGLRMRSKPTVVYEETTNMQNGISRAKAFGLKHIQAKYEILDRETVKHAHDEGLFVITHKGKSRWGLKKRIDTNVDAIQTNNINLLIDLLD